MNNIVIGYVADEKDILSFGLSPWQWKELLTNPNHQGRDRIKESIPVYLRRDAIDLKVRIEDEWYKNQENVIKWLEELTKWPFPQTSIHICVVPFQCSRVPFPELFFIFLGHITKGWHYPETIAHELAHLLFNYYTNFSTRKAHPLIQLIEEEIAVRLGHRSAYFAYDIPPEAPWVKTAQQIFPKWKDYLNHKENYRTIADLESSIAC
ncbi:MAG: hypothetical protein GWO20_16385 [Candidatus Korarchaeota archaeon]|nr:hypothetical protein [Candidatus Korarchaeota archaeon]